MANRRMFSLKIIDSAKFLKMPSSSRLLYFDLCMRADDDGVVEGFNVLRMTGATEDDLRILTAKGFIRVLNDDLVAFILDWNEHNKIRADRKIDSIYKDLLLKVVPDVKLIEPRKRADYKSKKLGTDNGQSMDCLGQDRIGKDKLGKVRLGEDSSLSINFYNEEVFKHFEKCGFIATPMLLEKISADIELYGTKSLMDAATESMERGKINNYKYVIGIVQNWQTEGREKQNGSTRKNNGEDKKFNIEIPEWKPAETDGEEPV